MVYKLNKRMFTALVVGTYNSRGKFVPGYGLQGAIEFLRSRYGLRITKLQVEGE